MFTDQSEMICQPTAVVDLLMRCFINNALFVYSGHCQICCWQGGINYVLVSVVLEICLLWAKYVKYIISILSGKGNMAKRVLSIGGCTALCTQCRDYSRVVQYIGQKF